MSRQNKSANPAAKRTTDLKVGVTIFLRDGIQTLWDNGIFQNAGFLLMLLKESRMFSKTFLVNGGPGMPENSKEFLSNSPVPVLTMDEAMNELDVIIELSAQLNPDWARDFKSRGGTVIGMRVASDFVIDSERMAYLMEPGMLFSKIPYDEIWTLPAFEKTCASYYQFGYSTPVHVMQHLWSPMLVDRSAKELGKPFAYRPGAKRWRLAEAVVSHHWENGQNYVYYEALHGGFPLIHNSDFLGSCGYRYDNYDPEDGGMALLRAKAEHDHNLEAYRAEARTFLTTLDPLNPVNIRNYENAIMRAMGVSQ